MNDVVKYYLSAATGTREKIEYFPLWSSESSKWLKSNCYRVARELNGQITEIDWPDVARNFVSVHFNDRVGRITVLFNVHWPIVAFLNPDVVDLYMPNRFIVCERAQTAFSMVTDFEVVPLEILEKGLVPDDWADLPKNVKSDFNYWRPDTLGEAVFNSWD